MKKYKLNVSVRKGLSDMQFGEFEIDNVHFSELFQISKLFPFKDDAYLTVSLSEISEDEAVGSEVEN